MNDNNYDIAVAAYVTPIGWIVAMIARELAEKRDDFTTFHLRQGLGLSVLEILGYIIFVHVVDIWMINQFALAVAVFFTFVGIKGALSGVMRFQPFIGRLYHRLFSFI